MAIKEAKQSGNCVIIKYDNTTRSAQGQLIGFSVNAVFVKNNRNLMIYVYKNGVNPCGRNISLMGDEDIKMYGNKVGIKRPNSPTVRLYDEKGCLAGTTTAR